MQRQYLEMFPSAANSSHKATGRAFFTCNVLAFKVSDQRWRSKFSDLLQIPHAPFNRSLNISAPQLCICKTKVISFCLFWILRLGTHQGKNGPCIVSSYDDLFITGG